MAWKSSQSPAHEAPSGSPASVWDRHRLLTLMATIALLFALAISLTSCDTTSSVHFPTLTPTPIPVITEFPLPTPLSQPLGITPGPDGALWFTEGGHRIGRISTNGTIAEFPLPADVFLGGITAGPDGALWFTEGSDTNSGCERMTVDGAISQFPLPKPDSGPFDITVGPDGNLWFTESRGNRIGRITPAGAITEFRLPAPPRGAYSIVAGPDDALWFTEDAAIGRLSMTGA